MPAGFTDGPYLDVPPGATLTPDATTGQITYTIGFQAFDLTGTTYPKGAFVSDGGQGYESLQNNNIGNAPASSPTWWEHVPPGVAWGPAGVTSADIGRHVRVLNEPATWDSGTSYSAGTAVEWQGTYYTASAGSTGVQPDTDLTTWALTPYVAQWNWGIVVAVPSTSQFTLQLMDFVAGEYLYTDTITTWRPGAYGGSTGVQPTCGTYTEGRLFLGGAYINRWDASMSNDFLTFTPTGADGTVADNNAISYTFNSADQNQIVWMHPGQSGVIAGTVGGEWLIQATQMGDPITPTSAQAHRVTKYECSTVEPRATGLSTVFVQREGRQVLEFITDVFTGKYSAPELTLAAKHITTGGVADLAYNIELLPIVWARMNTGNLAGCTYRRISSFATEEPTFVGWHRHLLGSGRAVASITEARTPDGTLPTIIMVTTDGTTGHIEALQPVFDQTDVIYDGWHLDDALCPQSAKITATGVVYGGLFSFTGKTLSAFVCGLDCGDYPVVDGTITVPFGAAGGKFTLAFLQSLSGLTFKNGSPASSIVTVNPPPPDDPGSITILQDTMPAWQTDSKNMAVNWGSNVAYVQMTAGFSDSGIWAFNMANGAPLANILTGSLFIDGPMIVAVDGNVYCASGASSNHALEQFNPTTLAHTASYGTADISTNVDYGHFIGAEIMASVGAGGAPMLAAMGQGNIASFTLAPMSYAGNKLAYTGAIGGMAPAPNEGAVYTSSWDATHLYVYQTSIGPNAATWPPLTTPPAAWSGATNYFVDDQVSLQDRYYQSLINANLNNTPTAGGDANWTDITDANPYITTRAIATLAPADIDATWPNFDTTLDVMTALWYDQTDGDLIFFAHTLASVPQQSYLVKMRVDGSIVWKAPITGTVSRIGVNTIIKNGVLAIWSTGGGGHMNVVNTLTGAFSTYSIPGVAMTGFSGSAMSFDTATGKFVALMDYAGTTPGAPQPSSPTTPYSFNGTWAMVDLGGRFQGTASTTTTYEHSAVVGFTYTSQGQLLRPIIPQDTGAQDGPALGKLRRIAQYSALVSQAGVGALSVGTSFTKLRSVTFKTPGGTVIQAPTLFNGVLWDTLEDDSNFDGQICWQISRPLPLTLNAIGGFPQTQDK